MNKELKDGTEVDSSTTAQVTTSASLAQNPLLNAGWISVNESLPDSGENVLIHHKEYGIGIGYCIPLDGSFAGTFHGIPVIDEDKQTTHWMKLPVLPTCI